MPRIKTISVVKPTAAGNTNVDFVVPYDKVWRPLYGHVVLTTNATAGTRRVIVTILDESSNILLDIHSDATQGATATYHHDFMIGQLRDSTAIDNTILFPVPHDCYLQEGWTWRISVQNGLAADTIDANFSFHVER